MDAYEVTVMIAQMEILIGSYNPTEQQRLLHDWLFTQYAIPGTPSGVNATLADIGGVDYLKNTLDIASSVNRLTNLGIISETAMESLDTAYWVDLYNEQLCNDIDGCDFDVLKGISDPPAETLLVVNYGRHLATISLTYNPCEATIPICSAFLPHYSVVQ